MTSKRLGKVFLVWLCIAVLVLPFCSEVLAAALTQNDTTANLQSLAYRSNNYAYRISGTDVLKIKQKGDTEYLDALYCVNAGLSFPIAESSEDSYVYTKVANDFTLGTDSKVAAWKESVGISDENYQKLINLLNTIYLVNSDSSYKHTLISKAFADLLAEETTENGYAYTTTVDDIEKVLTDEDIDVIQQWAIWYYTNGSNSKNTYYNSKFESLGSIQMKKIATEFEDLATGDSTRNEYMKTFYSYLIKTSEASDTSTTTKTYPSIDKASSVTTTVDGDYYVVGPFKVNSGNTTPSDFKATISAVGGTLTSGLYKVYVDGADVTATANLSELELDKAYYIYLPTETNTITSLKLDISYTPTDSRTISLWEGKDDSENPLHLQPIILITPGEEVEDSLTGTVATKTYDLALRKFVVSVNGDATTGRTPVVTESSLKDLAEGKVTTAEYTHSKSALSVKKGDKIVYEFRIYNEGDLTAKVKKIVDYLPEGLTVVDSSNSSINSKYNWEVSGTTLTNTYLSNTEIPAFDKTNLKLSYVVLQLECEITGDLAEGTMLTNVAEIVSDNGTDRDSTEGSIDKSTITDDFTGNTSNKDDLSDSSYYYKGLQDDDDFEKLVIEGKQFDLSLKKFISSVNGTKLSREPVVDASPLNNGKDDATYKTVKTPVEVATGDIVTFTLRVYNEGDIAGYAEQITDYIPEGLGFLVNYNTNYDNKWQISTDSKSVKLSTIKDGTSNLKLSDFTDVENLDNVDVVIGSTKITSTALASSATSDTNLIKAFDGTTLSYKDVQVSCIVVTTDELTLKNIAAITAESDENRDKVETDRGSKYKDSTPIDDINPDKYTDGNEDDDDYDVVKTDKKDFDLALQKFITALNDKAVTDRTPIVSVNDGKVKYTKPNSEALYVGNGDLVTYTIRVYNEGEIDGYAAEIADDIPTGLVFVPDNETNKEYAWKMYDKSGNETTDVNQAVRIKTVYLAKESQTTPIKAFDGSSLSYQDVKVVFKIDETAIDKTVTTTARTLTNTAEITKNTDSDGNDIFDVDSTPDNNVLTEDDIDQEKVYVKYFDLALEKNLTKAIVTVDGQSTDVNVADGEEGVKIEVNRKKVNTTKIQFVYNIIVKNEGEIEGYATEVTDYIPNGLKFDASSNPDWTQASDKIIKTNALAKTLLQPGETATVQVILDWETSADNTGKFVNIAEISDDWNPYDSDDVDSTPNNLVPSEDDYDTAPVWISIATGLGDQPYVVLTTVVLVILGTGIFLIKKYVLTDM